jgi:hypothetical protein
VCCGGLEIDASLFPMLDGGDASFDFAEAGGAGAAGLPAELAGITAETFCQASCSASQAILCGSVSDCPSGLVCGPALSALGAADAGAGLGGLGGAGGLGAALGGGGGLLSLMACQPPTPDAATLPLESGAPSGDAGEAGASSIDAGTDASPMPSEAAPPSDGATSG